MRPIDLVLERLKGVQEHNGSFRAFCPAHNDRNTPNLDIKEGDEGQVLLICRAGCKTEAVVDCLGLSLRDLFSVPADSSRGGHQTGGRSQTVWSIRDADGGLQAEHVRWELPGGKKKCLWRLPSASEWGLRGRKVSTLPLYRSEYLKEWPEDTPVVVVEGEKAADALAVVYPATLGTVTGAEGCPEPEVLGILRGRSVVLWPDADDPGYRHMRRIAEVLDKVASEIRWFEWKGAPEKGDAADHPTVTGGKHRDVQELRDALAAAARWEPTRSPSSQLPNPYRDGTEGRRPELLRFVDMPQPGPRHYLLGGLVPEAHFSLLYGDGGVAKSTLALTLGLAVASEEGQWLEREVENGPVLYLDFELDAEEQARRVRKLCLGNGLASPPDRLFYLSALGYKAQEAFGAAQAGCAEHGVRLLILDSLGPALQGDAEASKDVIGFFQRVAEPFREMGVAILIIDHQSKLQVGQSYQSKGAFGSVFKSNLARSVLQVEGTRRGEGMLRVTVRQKKHNFGPLADPFGVELSFAEERVSLKSVELDAAELAGEGTLNAADRIALALEDGPAFPSELAEATGINAKTVSNTLTRLRRQGTVVSTGNKEGRAEQVRLVAPMSGIPPETT